MCPTLPPPSITAIPQTQSAVIAAAAASGMIIPDACLPGVLANLALLGRHAALILSESDPACE